MNNNYLIPSNAKKSLMIFGLFNPIDLAIFLSGVGVSLILMMALPIADTKYAIISILPGCVAGLLVFPVPNYHNVLTVIQSAWVFVTTRQRFIWKGWCVLNGKEESEK